MKFKSLISLVLVFAGSMSANTFDYSFVFGGEFHAGGEVHGTFTGDINGVYVQNLSDITLDICGLDVAGPIHASAYSHFGGAPTISFDSSLNDFLFSPDFYGAVAFWFDPGFAGGKGAKGAEQIGMNYASCWAYEGIWTLTDTTLPDAGAHVGVSVPEAGSTVAMLIAGCLIVGLAKSPTRRKEPL